MKNLFSNLTVVALVLTCFNVQAETNEKLNKSAIGATYSNGESNTGALNYNKVWNSCYKDPYGTSPAFYFDASLGFGEHKATGEQTPSLSTTAAVGYSCHNILLGIGATATKNLSNTVSDDSGIMPTIIFGYNGEDARVIGKIKFADDKYDNQGKENGERSTYTNVEIGVSKTF